MKIFTFIFCLFLSLNALGQGKDTAKATDTSRITRDLPSAPVSTKPLVVVDGRIFKKNLKTINPKDIEKINVLKGESAIALYGTAAANGAVLITMKQSWRKAHKEPPIGKPLVVLDGIIFKGDIKTIDPKTIAQVSILKGDKATPLWGAAGANGAIIITTKAVMRKMKPDTIR